MIDGRRRAESRAGSRLGGQMGSKRRPLGRSYSGDGRPSAYGPPGPGSDGEDNWPLVEYRPERRNYLLSVRPENRSTFCTIIAQLTEETQPVFQTTLRSYSVSENADAKFTCIVTGYPQPEVTWYKDDEEMDRYCGLPKYQILRHGNRHTLQLYKCGEEDAAIYQASARNTKGIVSCSGVLEVGTMTEYKIHQRWFAKLKRKAEAKLLEIQQGRKRGKENVAMEQLRRVSPDRFQRKRRLTGEVGLHSGVPLWDEEEEEEEEEVAKMHIPVPKSRFSEEDSMKGKDAAALFSNNFVTGEVTTNGDSSLESGEENGEGNANGFLSYIYETVEMIKNRPATRETSAKKQKKEEDGMNLPNAGPETPRQPEEGMPLRISSSGQKDAKPTTSSGIPFLIETNGQVAEAGHKERPSWVTEKQTSLPYSPSSKGDVYFSLKDMYFDIGMKPEGERKVPEENAGTAEVCQAATDAASLGGTLPPATMASKGAKPEEKVQNELYPEQKAEETEAREAKKSLEAAKRLKSPHRTTEPATEGGNAAKMSGKSGLGTNVENWTPETGVKVQSPRSKGNAWEMLNDADIRETDLLDYLPADGESALQPQDGGGACMDSALPFRVATGGSQVEAAPLEPQQCTEAPCKAPPHSKPALTTARLDLLQHPGSGHGEELNQEAANFAIKKDAPGAAEPRPAARRGHQDVLRQGGQGEASVASQSPSGASLGTEQLMRKEKEEQTFEMLWDKHPKKMEVDFEPPVLHESQGTTAHLPAKEGLAANRNPSVAHWLRDGKNELDTWPPASELEEHADLTSVEEARAKEESPSALMGEEDEHTVLTLEEKLEVANKDRGRRASNPPVIQDSSLLETSMEEDKVMDKSQHKNLVTSLKNYLLLLLKMTTDANKNKSNAKREAKAAEERPPPPAIPRHVTDMGIAGLTPRTSRKIFEQVETDQLFQNAESLQLTPRTSRRITGLINQEMLACKEVMAAEPQPPPLLPCVPSIVVGSVSSLERLGLPDLPPELSSEVPAALPSATPEELASGARRKIFLSKTKQVDEMEGATPDSQTCVKRDSPTVSPQQNRKNALLLQTPSPAPSPPMERRSPTIARKMATLDVPKIYGAPTEESKNVTNNSMGALENLEEMGQDSQIGESRKANDPFKAPQVVRKIRPEQFSEASGNLKLWCHFFNILSDSKLTWCKDEMPVAEARRSAGDEGQAALAIAQVSLKDCGVYQCTIQNEYGTDSTDFLLSAEVLSGFISKEELEVGEEIEMTPMVFAKGLADSGYWGDKLFGRIMLEDLEVGHGFVRKACRARAIYGLEPVFESGHTGIIKVHNLITFGGRSENTLVERNYDITIQECKIQNSSREYCKIFAAEARAIPAFGPVPEIIPLYLIYRPANNIPYATMEEDLPGLFERFCGRERDGNLAPASVSEVGHKCCAFQHWLFQWTNGNILVTDLEGVGWKITNVRIATKTKGYQGLKESCCPSLLEHFATAHQCNSYCELLALKTLEPPQPPAKGKGPRSPVTGRKVPSSQSSPQLQKKGLASPQATRKGSVSPKSARKGPEAAVSQPAAKPKAGDSRLQ